MQKGQIDEARKILYKVQDQESAEERLQTLMGAQKKADGDDTGEAGYKDLCTPAYRNQTIIGCFLSFF